MHLHNDSSISDLLPWQTLDNPEINFIQKHLAAIAKMAPPKPQNVKRVKPLSQQKRHRTLTNVNSSRKRCLEVSRQNESRVRVSTGSPDKNRSRKILSQSLHQSRFEKIMENTQCSSPIRVTQISTDHETISLSRKKLKEEYLRYPSETKLDKLIPKPLKGGSQKVTFAQFLQKKKKEEKTKKEGKTKHSKALCFELQSAIHVRPAQKQQISLQSKDAQLYRSEIQASKTVDVRVAPRERRKLTSSNKIYRKMKESQNLSKENDFSQNCRTIGLFLRT